MANTKSAEKAARQAEKHRAHNVTLRSRMRSAIRDVSDAIAAGKKDEAQKSYAAAVPRMQATSETSERLASGLLREPIEALCHERIDEVA